MSAIQKLFRRNQPVDPIRESAALTTVYLLELNKKFEAFVREKVEALEPVVSSLEARGSQAEEGGIDDDWEPAGDNFERTDTPMSASGDKAALFTETKLVTPMPPPLPATDPCAAPVPPAAPPVQAPGRGHRALQNDETGVGRNFSFNMLDDGAGGADANVMPPALRLAEKRDEPATPHDDLGRSVSAGDEDRAPDDATGEPDPDDAGQDDEKGGWEYSLADDLPGPKGEFE